MPRSVEMVNANELFVGRMKEFQRLAEAHGFKNVRAWGHKAFKRELISQKVYDSVEQLLSLYNSLCYGSGRFVAVSNDALSMLGTVVRTMNDLGLYGRKADPSYILDKGTFRSCGGAGRRSRRGARKGTARRGRMERTVYIKENVYGRIMAILGREKPELGGMLGFSDDQCVIDRFVFDEGAAVTGAEYNPNTEFLSGLLNNEWKASGTFLAGFVHSHPGDFNRLSGADVEYACRIMKRFDLPFLFMPVVTSSYSYRASLTGYIVNADGSVEECDVIESPCGTVELEEGLAEVPPEKIAEFEAAFAAMGGKKESDVSGADVAAAALSQDDTFARIRPAIDVEYMGGCTVIGIGCGGARSFYESMARMGVGHFVLMDGDVASRSNVASQNGYLSEVGMQKPELIKRRILDINADAEVQCHDVMLDDGLDDAWIEEHFVAGRERTKCLVCAFTDSFPAQARVSRIAVKYGLPFLAGQHHRAGETSELVFWYPGVTRYSCRDIALDRYKAYRDGFENDVSSAGSPIFNTTRLNALCEKIAAGMLLYGNSPMNPYSRFLDLKCDRNLLLIRQKFLLLGESGLKGLFEDDGAHHFDDTVWVRPEEVSDGLDALVPESELEIADTRDIFEGIS